MKRNGPIDEEGRLPLARPRRLAALACALAALFLVATCLAPRTTHADDEPLQVFISVDGFEGSLPTLVEGTDFVRDAPIGSDPRYMVDADGTQPLAALVETKEAQGYSLVWRADGDPFDWFGTPITHTLTVFGTFEEACYEVRVSLEDGDDDLVVSVKRGQPFADANGAAPQAPVKTGYAFERWVDAADGSTFDFDAPVFASTTVYPEYRLVEPARVTPTDLTKDVPQTLSGRCYIGATWSVHPAQFSLSRFTGGLAGCSGTGSCSLPSAAAPSYTWANYTATLKSVDAKTGKVVYDVAITPPGAASPNGPRNSLGLIGYQTVAFQAVMYKSFGGYLELTKSSAHPALSEGNANYSYRGAVFGVYDADGASVARLTTDANGKTGQSSLLPVGTYTVKEEQVPSGYATASDRTVTVESGKTTAVAVADQPQSAPIDVILGKVDAETGQPLPLGSASLQGARFKVSYYDRHLTADETVAAALAPIASNGEAIKSLRNSIATWGQPKRSWTFETDASGTIAFDETHLVDGDALYRDAQGSAVMPLGVVVVEETQAPDGYLKSTALIVRDIRTSGTSEHVSAWQHARLPERVVRGDFSFTKVRADTMERLSGVPFRITSKTTGESHVIVTDENGMVNTAATWTPHSQNTNAGQSAQDGVWFGVDADGNEAPVDDALGALPFDSYTIEELACPANDGLILVAFTITISRNAVALNLGTVDNKAPGIEISGEVDKRETIIDADGAFSYAIDYRSTSNTWADEFNLVDEITCAQEGQAHLVSLTTPVCFEDYDGLMNVWYRTNLDDEAEQESEDGEAGEAPLDEDGNSNGEAGGDASDDANGVEGDATSGTVEDATGDVTDDKASEADAEEQPLPNACVSNPPSNGNPDNARVRDFTGWRVWATEVSTLEPCELAVADLNLAEGERVTAIAFEHGRVEEGFGTDAQDSGAWSRHGRYEVIDVADPIAQHDARFDLSQAQGPTKTDEETEIAYAPAVLVMQVTEETLAAGSDALWNDASIDIHRDLDKHDQDEDSVVQSVNPIETIVESPSPVETALHAAATRLPKTDDAPYAVAKAATCLALVGLAGVAATRAWKRERLRRAVRARL